MSLQIKPMYRKDFSTPQESAVQAEAPSSNPEYPIPNNNSSAQLYRPRVPKPQAESNSMRFDLMGRPISRFNAVSAVHDSGSFHSRGRGERETALLYKRDLRGAVSMRKPLAKAGRRTNPSKEVAALLNLHYTIRA